jgi:hypothetical protein
MARHRRPAAWLPLLLVLLAPGAAAAQGADPLNDYPTVARADYVFACMAVNGRTRQTLEQCSCSIDHVARIIPYEKYVRAETVLRTLQVGGERIGALRNSQALNAAVDELRRARAEADMICF